MAWLTKNSHRKIIRRLLDLGCGPGIYAEKFAQAVIKSPELIFLKTVLAYARQAAQKQQLPIRISKEIM